MTVFYRGPRALITHRTFEVRHPCRAVFLIHDLRSVHIVETAGPSRAPIVWASSGSAGIAAVMVLTNGLDMPTPLALLGGLVLLVAAGLGATTACLRPPSRGFELRAVYRGRVVSMFHSTNYREFGQVRRALLRAIENVTDG